MRQLQLLQLHQLKTWGAMAITAAISGPKIAPIICAGIVVPVKATHTVSGIVCISPRRIQQLHLPWTTKAASKPSYFVPEKDAPISVPKDAPMICAAAAVHFMLAIQVVPDTASFNQCLCLNEDCRRRKTRRLQEDVSDSKGTVQCQLLDLFLREVE